MIPQSFEKPQRNVFLNLSCVFLTTAFSSLLENDAKTAKTFYSRDGREIAWDNDPLERVWMHSEKYSPP